MACLSQGKTVMIFMIGSSKPPDDDDDICREPVPVGRESRGRPQRPSEADRMVLHLVPVTVLRAAEGDYAAEKSRIFFGYFVPRGLLPRLMDLKMAVLLDCDRTLLETREER